MQRAGRIKRHFTLQFVLAELQEEAQPRMMSQLRLHTSSLRARWAILLTYAASATLLGCIATDASSTPEGGQTGSPALPPNGSKVTPGQSSPVPFRSPEPPPPPGGASPSFPAPRAPATQRVAQLGNTLYVADRARGLVVLDGSDATPRIVNGIGLAGGASWVHVVGERLVLVGPGSAGLDAFEGTEPVSSEALLFDLADPARPALLDAQVVPGRMLEVRASEQHFVVLTAEYGVGACSQTQSLEGGVSPSSIGIHAFEVAGAALELRAQESIAGESYLTADNGYLITQGSVFPPVTTGSVTAVDLSAPGELKVWPTLAVEGHAQSTPVRIDSEQLLFVAASPAGPVFTRATLVQDAEVQLETLLLPLQVSTYDGVFGAMDDSFAVLNAPEAGTGVVLDLRGEQLAQVAEVPDTWRYVNQAGEHWFACDSTSAFSFELSATGELVPSAAVATPLMIATGRYFPQAHWDRAAQRLFVPYREQTNGEVTASHVGALDFSGPELVWVGGSTLTGEAERFAGNRYAFDAFTASANFYTLTEVGATPPQAEPTLLETFALQDGAEAGSVVELGALPEAIALTDEYEIRLQRGSDQVARLDVRELETADSQLTLQLKYAADQLVRVEDSVWAYSTHYTNECSPDGLEGFGPCLDHFRPAIAVLELAPQPQVVRETLLPTVNVAPRTNIALYSWEWLEFVQQGAHVGLLQYRGFMCSTVAACDELNVPYEPDPIGVCDDSGQCVTEPERVRGHSGEQWFYPFDRQSGAFAEPFQVGSATGYDYVTASGIASDETLNFLAFTALQRSADGIHTDVARFELVQARSGAEQARITLPGFPLRVAEPFVVSIAPSGPLTAGAAAAVNVQLSELFEGNAYVIDTLTLEAGHQDSRWAHNLGYVLLTPDDRCTQPQTQVVAIELARGRLSERGRIQLPGVEWRIAAVSDQRAVLQRGRGQQQYAEFVVTDDAVSLGNVTTVPEFVPVAVSKEQVRIGAEADRPRLP